MGWRAYTVLSILCGVAAYAALAGVIFLDDNNVQAFLFVNFLLAVFGMAFCGGTAIQRKKEED